MNDDNIGGFFSYRNLNDDENKGERWKPVKQYGDTLFKKAIDILNLTKTICDVLPEDEDAEMTRHLMMENASLVAAKIRGAMVMEYYSLLMNNAVIIKVNIVQLREQLWACKEFHQIEKRYISVLYDEIEAFRKIFIGWVTLFDKDNDVPDEWCLFNDPANFPDDFDSAAK